MYVCGVPATGCCVTARFIAASWVLSSCTHCTSVFRRLYHSCLVMAAFSVRVEQAPSGPSGSAFSAPAVYPRSVALRQSAIFSTFLLAQPSCFPYDTCLICLFGVGFGFWLSLTTAQRKIDYVLMCHVQRRAVFLCSFLDDSSFDCP